ncbi:TadE family type IV pilus minor pilin [Streptomyces hyderabadensis]
MGLDSGSGSGPDSGFVTAEAAVVLPVLVVFAMALVWGLLVVAAQIQCVDAARTGARAAARQDPVDAVVEVAREAAPPGAPARRHGRTRSTRSWRSPARRPHPGRGSR